MNFGLCVLRNSKKFVAASEINHSKSTILEKRTIDIALMPSCWQGAEYPLLRTSRVTVGRVAQGRLMTREEADRIIGCWTLLNTQTNMYECTVCDGAFKVSKCADVKINFKFCN